MYFCNAKVQNMDIKQRYSRLFRESKQLIFEPKKFWSEKQETAFEDNIAMSYYIPLVILVGIGIFLGEIIWNPELLLSYALGNAIREIASYLLQFFIIVPILQILIQNYKGTKNKHAISHLLAYSLLPFLAASFITGLFPGLYPLSIIGLYGFYLFIIGTKSCLEITDENRSKFIVLSILLIVLIFGMVNTVGWKILNALF